MQDDDPRGGGHLSIRAIAKTAGVSPSTVLRDLDRVGDRAPDAEGRIRVGWTMGIDGKLRPDRRFDTSGRDTEIVRRHQSGESVRQIAAAVGCSVGTVHRIVKRDA